MEFSSLGLSERTMAAINELGFTQPTPVQLEAIPAALAGRDVLARAQTGTGKTAAFILPIVERVRPQGRASALVVTPMRELALQIEEVARTVAKFTGHSVLAVYGGVPYKGQLARLHSGVDILVATPGRLLDLHSKGVVDVSGVEVLVLDEADRMLDMGFWPDVRRILGLLPPARQNMLFSATLSSEITRVIGHAASGAVRIEMTPALAPVDAIEQYLYPVNSAQKTELLVAYLRDLKEYRAIVFTRTKARADRLSAALKSSGIEVDTIHSDRTQQQRERTLKEFKRGMHALLVATDVMARGIHVESVTHVVNYDVPETPTDYIHRIGRTARAGETGTAITLVAYEDSEALKQIERVLGRALEHRDVPGFEYADRVVPNPERHEKKLSAFGGRRVSSRRPGGTGRTRRF